MMLGSEPEGKKSDCDPPTDKIGVRKKRGSKVLHTLLFLTSLTMQSWSWSLESEYEMYLWQKKKGKVFLDVCAISVQGFGVSSLHKEIHLEFREVELERKLMGVWKMEKKY